MDEPIGNPTDGHKFEFSEIQVSSQNIIRAINKADIVNTNLAPKAPPSYVSPKPRSIKRCFMPATKWKTKGAITKKKIDSPNGEAICALMKLKPSSDCRDLCKANNITNSPKKSNTPAIRCEIDEIAVIGKRKTKRSLIPTLMGLFCVFKKLKGLGMRC